MQCRKYINHIHRVVPVIIEKQGEAVVDDELPRVLARLFNLGLLTAIALLQCALAD